MAPDVALTIMSDGSIQAIGTEPAASELRISLERYFAAHGISGSAARTVELRRLMEDAPAGTYEWMTAQ